MVDLSAQTIADAGNAPIPFSGFDVVNITAASTLLIKGTPGSDGLTYTPTGATAGTVTTDGGDPTINFSGVAGAFTIDLLGGDDLVTVNGNSANNAITATGGAAPTVQVDASKDLSLVPANLESLVIRGLSGDDTLTVDATPGAFSVPLSYFGGSNFDTLVFKGTVASSVYVLGPTPDAGVNTMVVSGVTQKVTYAEIEPIVDLVVAATLTVNGTNANNAINYTQGSVAANGLVSVDGFETIEFSNKTTLTINGLAGDDVISLNNASTPTGLTGITVNGGDPSGSDTLIVNGTAGSDNIGYVPSNTIGSGSVTRGGAPTVSFTTIEQLAIDGQGGTDGLTLSGGSGRRITFTPGSAPDAGTIELANFGAGTGLAPLTFSHLGALGNVTFSGSGAGTDILLVNGTSNRDTFAVTGTGLQILNATGGFTSVILNTPGVFSAELRGLDGDDTFNVSGSLAAFSGGIVVDGGNPSASDVLNYTAAANAATTINLGAATIASTGSGLVSYIGIEQVNQTSSGAVSTMTVTGTAGDDTINVTPTGAGAGSFVRLGIGGSPQFTYAGIGAASGLTVNGGTGGFDVVGILGSAGVDAVTSTTTTITSNGGVVTFGADLDRVDVTTLGGDDNVNLSTFTSVAAIIRGGDGNDSLIGTTLGDTIYGGFGNDALMGAAGADTIYGEDGDDRFGDPAVADPAANDAGNDSFFGGAGSDVFVWDPGDGSDLIEGGEGNDALVFNGSAGAETFTFNAVGTRLELLRSLEAIDLDIAGVEQADLNAGGGTDTVVVQDLFTTELVSLNLNVGTTDAVADTVTLNGRTSADNLAITSPGAASAAVRGLRYDVNLAGLETADGLSVNGNNGNDSIVVADGVAAILRVTLSGGLGDDLLAGDAAIINGNEGNDTLIGSAIDNTFDGGAGDDTFLGNGGTDNIGGGVGSSVGDQILVEGTNGLDTISTTIDGSGFLVVTMNTITTTYRNFIGGSFATSGIERLQINSKAGSDSITVAPSATFATDVDGGDPIGQTPGDLLNLMPAGDFLIETGPEIDEGGLIPAGGGRVSWDHIERVSVSGGGGGGGVFLGTNGDDVITVIARDASTHAGTDGVQDFTVSLNDGSEILFIDQPSFFIDALAGDDDVVLRTPAPNDAEWGVDITIAGGSPAARTGDQGDVFVLETPLTDIIIFTPTGIDSGTFLIDEAASDSLISLVTTFTIPALYTSSPGGFEQFVYAGLGGNDTLTINGTAADDAFTFVPGERRGGFASSLGVPLDFTGVTAITANGGTGGFDVVGILGSAGVDAVTSTPTTITSNGGVVTFGADLDRVDVTTLGGDDNVNLSTFTSVAAIIRGGDGNDTITGTTLDDIIFGGAGNDILIGAAGSDTLYGEDGNDIFGNPTLTSDGVADDAGIDFNFGGPGFDNFVWEPGDGADFNNGGEDGADIFRFFGSAAANVFTLRSGGTPTHFNALIGAVNIDNHGIEDVIVDGQGGADTFVVDDLFATEVVSLNLVLGTADGAVDTVTVNGRAASDNVLVSTPAAGAVRISGLRYNVNVTAAEATDLLTLNGNDGNDSLNVSIGVAAILGVTLNGGAGDDLLAGDAAIINGNEGNDTLIGSAIDNTFDGGAGDDTFLGNGGTDAIGGGAGSSVGDTILLPGTAGIDALSLALNATGHLLATINGVTTTYTNFLAGPIATSGVERIKAEGQDGTDALTVDSANGSIPIPITFDGGASSDSLTLTGGTATADTYAPGPNPGAGTSTIVIGGVTQVVTFTGLEPVNDLVAGPLTVNANDAANSISYTVGRDDANTADDATRGKVSIDTQEFINFSNKTTLTINALGGSDTISLNNPNTPTGLTAIIVNGGDATASDELVITGTAGADVFTFAGVSLSAGTVTLTGAAPVAFTGIENAIADGQAGADVFNLSSAAGRLNVRGGEGSDTVDFSTDASGIVFNLDVIGVEQTVNATGQIIVLSDPIENLIGSPFNDVFFASLQNFPRTINGGTPSALPGLPAAPVPPGDILNFNALGQFSRVVKFDSNTGTILAPSFPDLAYDDIEVLKVLNSSSSQGFSGTEPGAFTAAVSFKVGKLPDKVVTGDVNGDGFEDIVTMSRARKTVSVLISNGDGTFEPAVKFSASGTRGIAPKTLILGNVDGDASIPDDDDDLDIIVANRNTGKVVVRLNDGTGNFGAPTIFQTTTAPRSLQVGDFNEDGLLDIATLNAGSRLGILLNTGAGVAGTASFGAVTKFKTGGIRSSDFVLGNLDADAGGHLDFAVVHAFSNKLTVLTGDGAGNFALQATKYKAGIHPTVLAIADFNNDTIADIAVNHDSRKYVGILFGRGSAGGGLFEPLSKTRSAVALGASYSMVAGDFNNDGNADLALGKNNGSKLFIALGEPDGILLPKVQYTLTWVPPASSISRLSSIAVGDFNGDGADDIVVSHRTDGMATVVFRRTSL